MTGYLPGSAGLLAPLDPYLRDKQVSEILVNRPGEIWVEKGGEMVRYACAAFHEIHLLRLFQLLAAENAQTLDDKHPLLSGSLQDGSRVQLVMTPTARYPALSIRRKVVRHFSLEDYQDTPFYQQARGFDIHADMKDQLSEADKDLIQLYQANDFTRFVKQAIVLKKNIVISGGTGSGKTTYLGACLRAIDVNDRIILLEDSREIEIPHPNQVALLASKGDQGRAKVSMQDLVQCCLRLRPDRIIVGEIRGKEILDFLSASSTGHEGSLTSIHANNPRIALMRMTQMYKQNKVPSMTDSDILREINEVVDIIIQVTRDKGDRYIESVYYKHGHIALGKSKPAHRVHSRGQGKVAA